MEEEENTGKIEERVGRHGENGVEKEERMEMGKNTTHEEMEEEKEMGEKKMEEELEKEKIEQEAGKVRGGGRGGERKNREEEMQKDEIEKDGRGNNGEEKR